jgi:hypothetical protein
MISSSIGAISNIIKGLSVTLAEDMLKKLCSSKKKNGLRRGNTLIRQQQRASEKQLDLLYGEELLNFEEKNLTRNHRKFLRKYKKKMGLTTRKLDVIVIIASSLVMSSLAVLFELVPGSLTSIAFSILNSFNGPILFIYMCAKFNEFSTKRFKFASHVGKHSKLNNFRFRSVDVIASCLVAIGLLQFFYAGQVLTMREYGDYYNFEKWSPRPVQSHPSESQREFCKYEERNVTESVISYEATTSTARYKLAAQAESTPGTLAFFFGISFNWYSTLGFILAIVTLFVLNVCRLVVSLLAFCLNKLFCSFNTRNVLFL